MKDIPNYLIKLTKDFINASNDYDKVCVGPCTYETFNQVNDVLKEKALAIAFAMSCELWKYCEDE